jgi:hypothetical protein
LRKVLVVLVLVLLPGLALAATPSEGVALKVRRGFFTETDVGLFFTAFGGEHGYSNAQTYLQLGVGYDLTQNIALGVHFGIGSNAANCWAGVNERTGECGLDPANNPVSENFTVTFLNATAAYLFPLAERFYLSPKLTAGYALLDPSPVEGVKGGLNFGGGVGVEYATSMDHFTIGADVLWRMIAGPNIHSFSIFPRVKYTF